MTPPCHGPGNAPGIETTAEGHGRAGGRGEDVERHLAPALPAQGRRPAETRDPVRIPSFFERKQATTAEMWGYNMV